MKNKIDTTSYSFKFNILLCNYKLHIRVDMHTIAYLFNYEGGIPDT